MSINLQNNDIKRAALFNELALLDASGLRIPGTYFSDNFVTLVPGEARGVQVSFPRDAKPAFLLVRGKNGQVQRIAIP